MYFLLYANNNRTNRFSEDAYATYVDAVSGEKRYRWMVRLSSGHDPMIESLSKVFEKRRSYLIISAPGYD